MRIKQIMTSLVAASAVCVCTAGLASASVINFDFNNMKAELVDITLGTAADFGTAGFEGTLTMTDDANTLLQAIDVDGVVHLPGPITPADFTISLDIDGLSVTGGSLSFSDGIETYNGTIGAGVVTYFGFADSFTVITSIDGDTGSLPIFGLPLDLDGTGAAVSFDLGGSSIRSGSDANAYVDVSLGGVIPAPSVAASGLIVAGMTILRRRRER